jgi:hypothetical protein
VRTEPGVTVQCLSCGHVGVLTREALSRLAIAPGTPDRGVRQATPLPEVREPQRARDAQAGTAAPTSFLKCAVASPSR